MADSIGAVSFPAPPSGNNPVADPLLDSFGGYLQAYVNAVLSSEWSKLAPEQQRVINSVTTANSSRAWFDDKALPTLFLFRHRLKPEKLRDDVEHDVTQLYALWMPPKVAYTERERRDPFSAKVAATIKHALRLGRHPYWVDRADTDPDAATLGSVLMDRARLLQEPRITLIDFDPKIKIHTADGDVHDYDAVLVVIDCVEEETLDPALRGVASKMTLTVDQVGDGDADDFIVRRQYGS